MSQYCHCGPKLDMALATKQPAPSDWQAREVWVCHLCGKISHAVQEEHETVRGPKDATAILHANAWSGGQETLTWATPEGRVQTVEFRTYPRRQPGAMTEPLIYSTWELLMGKVAVILKEPEGAGDNELQALDRERARFEGRGVAEVLAILMAPFMESPDMVVKQAVKKYKDPEHVVPGLGEHLFDPLYNSDGSFRTPIADTKKRTPVRGPIPAAKRLSESEAQSVRDMIKGGMMKADELARMFDVPLASILEATKD